MPEDSSPEFSETSAAVDVAGNDSPVELAVPLRVFAATLGPRVTHRQVIIGGVPRMVAATASAGHPDEVWMKLLSMRHQNERHTMTEWQALIEKYRDEPAHPLHPRWGVN